MTPDVRVEEKPMRWMVAVMGLVVSAGSAVAECPAGAYPWVDRRGVEVCRRDMMGPREPVFGGKSCPHAMRTATDRRGGHVCKRLGSARGQEGSLR
jgi:hypothetical protein